MNPRIFFACIVFACEMLAINQADAQLFRRGSCSTGYCGVSHHATPVVQQRDIIQQIFFAAPAGYIAPVGETSYGLSRALDLIAPDPNAFLNNSNAHIAAASSSSASARQVSADVLAVEQTNAIERQINAKARGIVDAARALAGDVAIDQPRSLILTMRNGQYESVREVKPDEPQAMPRGQVGGMVCMKCHAADGSAAAKFVIDDTFDELKMLQAKEAIDAGTMPPKARLTEAEKLRLVLQLGRLVPAQ
jgi:hypothetical protein